MTNSELDYWDKWDRIIKKQREIQGPIVSVLISEVAEFTENMDSFELDVLEGHFV